MWLQLPGSSFSTHEQRNDYSGVTERMVYRREYDTNLSFTFMVNNQYDAVEMFDGWMDFIAGQEDTSSFLSPYASYRTSYANDYRTNIHITKFEKNVDAKSLKGERPRELRYTMVGAYPISTQPMQVGYGDKNNMLQYSVYMTFIRYVRERETHKPHLNIHTEIVITLQCLYQKLQLQLMNWNCPQQRRKSNIVPFL